MLIKYLHKTRYISIIAVFCSLLGSILMFLIGIYRTYLAYAYFFNYEAISSESGRDKIGDLATGAIIKSVDSFLIGLAFLIFGYGIYNLFVRNIRPEETAEFHWLKINSMTKLKILLVEVIILILFVKFINVVILNINELTWQILLIPVSILLLALSLKFLEQRH